LTADTRFLIQKEVKQSPTKIVLGKRKTRIKKTEVRNRMSDFSVFRAS
jgi:hypothetical protein